MTIIAGNGGYGFSGDGGPATSASLSSVSGVAIDSAGNVFIVDRSNQRVRRVDAATGIITTIAGNGTSGFSGDGGDAASAIFDSPTGVAVDVVDNLYVADFNNHRIRLVNFLAVETLVGFNVVVQPIDRTTGTTPVTLTFDEVTAAGFTSLMTTGGGPPAATGFKLGNPPPTTS